MTQATATLSPLAGAALPAHVQEDTAALGHHLLQCRQASGVRHATALWLDSTHRWIGPRFMTTVTGATLLLAVLSWWA